MRERPQRTTLSRTQTHTTHKSATYGGVHSAPHAHKPSAPAASLALNLPGWLAGRHHTLLTVVPARVQTHSSTLITGPATTTSSQQHMHTQPTDGRLKHALCRKIATRQQRHCWFAQHDACQHAAHTEKPGTTPHALISQPHPLLSQGDLAAAQTSQPVLWLLQHHPHNTPPATSASAALRLPG